MTDQRGSADDRQLAPEPPPRLGGTDLFRGAMVIMVAVIIGVIVLSRGIDGETTADPVETAEQVDGAEVDPAAGDTTTASVTGAADAAADPNAENAGTDPLTGAAAGTEDPATTPTAPAASTDGSMTDSDPAASSSTTTPVDAVLPPAEVRTLVLNAGGPQGIAGRATELLQAASYQTSAAKNADLNGPSAIYYVEGFEAEAQAVASVFGPGLETLVQPLDPAAPPSDDLQQASVIVVVGNDDVIAVP